MTGTVMPLIGRRFARMGEGRWTGGGGTADASQRRRYAGGEGENTQCRTPNVQFPREERRGGWRPGRVRDCMDGFGWAVGNRRHGWGGGLRGWGRGVGRAEVEPPTPRRGAATRAGRERTLNVEHPMSNFQERRGGAVGDRGGCETVWTGSAGRLETAATGGEAVCEDGGGALDGRRWNCRRLAEAPLRRAGRGQMTGTHPSPRATEGRLVMPLYCYLEGGSTFSSWPVMTRAPGLSTR